MKAEWEETELAFIVRCSRCEAHMTGQDADELCSKASRAGYVTRKGFTLCPEDAAYARRAPSPPPARTLRAVDVLRGIVRSRTLPEDQRPIAQAMLREWEAA